MAFIGNTPTTQAFTPAVDYFSGNGSTTAFTLSRPVASVAQVEAVIENVVQNPSSAYTISGNTITFTSAPPSGTNNIYVRYTSPITQVIAPSQGTVSTTTLSASLLVPVANGGSGATTLTANNVLLGNGTSAFQTVAPGSSGNILTSNGTTWTSSAPAPGGVTSVSAGNGIAVSGTTSVTVSLDYYTGSDAANTSFPIGSYVVYNIRPCTSTPNCNASVTIYLGPSCNRTFYLNTNQFSGSTLAGTWRSRGRTASDYVLAQRTA